MDFTSNGDVTNTKGSVSVEELSKSDNGDLAGPVPGVPSLVPALAMVNQEPSGDVILITGTGAVVPAVHYYGKREAEADPALLYLAYGYARYPRTHGAFASGYYGYPCGGYAHHD